MKKLILLVAPFAIIGAKDKAPAPRITESTMIKHVPGYKGMSPVEQNKAKLDVAKGMRRGLQVQRLLELDDMYEASGVVGPQMKQADKDFCRAVDALNNQISTLEGQLKSEGHSSSGSTRFHGVGEKIGKGFKYTWEKIKCGCGKLKSGCKKIKEKIFKHHGSKKSKSIKA